VLEPHQTTYRFGPFEADSKTGELRKDGNKLKLQELPFRLLVSLLERPGELVSREELQAKLWPGGTFVDFERGIGTALNKVREALCDSATAPRFIETIPRRGFRFLVEVQKSEPPRDEVEKIEILELAAPIPPVRPARNHPVAALIAGSVLVILVSGAAYWRFRNQPSPMTNQDVLVLADFTNTTGETAFDGALRPALAIALEQSPFLKIMDDQEVSETLQRMGHPAGPITNDIAHEVCVREGQKATIGGSIAGFGRNYELELLAVNCQTGVTLAREQAVAEDKEHVLKAVAEAAAGIRAKLGESLSSIQKPDRLPTFLGVTTQSLAAFKAYAIGVDLFGQIKPREAIPHFRRAIELDPTFAEAYELLGSAYRSAGDLPSSSKNVAMAFALSAHASDRERLIISGTYYQLVTHELNRAIEAYRVLARIDPRNPRPHNRLFGIYFTRGEYEKALEEQLETVRLEPRVLEYVANLVLTYTNLDRFDEAKAVAAKAIAQKLEGPFLHKELLTIAYIQDDHAGQEREIQLSVGKPEESESLKLQAYNALLRGQRRKAKDLYQRAFQKARQEGVPDTQRGWWAWIDANVGDCEAARKEQDNDALLLCGDPSALRRAEEQMAKNPPPNPDTADLLYQRGLSALAAGGNAEAAAEFQKILDHKGRHWILQSHADLGLARAAARSGDTAKAKRAYQDFLTLWKDADKDAPNLVRATEELAALR
jgi:DNA-binding winged helix-turn-helix (wHTH) protein/tetratricopeptide (TPR) repeat protein